MPYRLIWEDNGVYRQYLGDVTIAERRHSLDQICGDRRFDRLRYTITDYLAVCTYEVSTLSTQEIAALHIGPMFTNPAIWIAAVADRADIIEAIEAFKSWGFISAPYRVFAELDEARRWVLQNGS